MDITFLNDANRVEVDRYIKDEWGGPIIATLGNLYDSSILPGYAALEGSQIIGGILYRLSQDECEIATLYSLLQNRGVGTALIKKVIETAREHHCRRIWLVTTNDNTHAIRFYQKFGFALKAVHIGSFEGTRRLKNELPAKGMTVFLLSMNSSSKSCYSSLVYDEGHLSKSLETMKVSPSRPAFIVSYLCYSLLISWHCSFQRSNHFIQLTCSA